VLGQRKRSWRIRITRSTTIRAGLTCLIAASAAAYGVYVGADPAGPFVAYLVALAASSIALGARPPVRLPRPTRDLVLIVTLAAAQLALIDAFTRLPFHFHSDEFVTAYASWELPRIDRIDWFRGYPGDDEWLAHFPIVWFALQKPFLMALGPSVDAIRVSTWPYHVAIVAYLYWLARALFADRTMAVLATGAFMVLAPSVYLAGLGVYFGGSTLALLAVVYHGHWLTREGRARDRVLCGLWIGLAYLYWAASYVTLPLLLLFVAIEVVARRSLLPARRFAPALLLAALVLLPFGVYAATRQNYFTSRSGQVSLFGGEWAGEGGTSLASPAFRGYLGQHLSRAARSVYEDEVGGVTHYSFGHRALFGPSALVLGAIGLFGCAHEILWRGRSEFAYPMSVILTGLLVGLVLSVPAGAYHRLAPTFPFVGLLVAAGLRPAAWVGGRAGRRFGRAPLGAGLAALALFAVYGWDNAERALAMVQHEPRQDSVYLAALVEATVPRGGRVVVVAPRDYHLARELFFRMAGSREFVGEPVAEALQRDEPNPTIVLLPNQAAVDKLIERFAEPRIVTDVGGWTLTDHVAIFPGPDVPPTTKGEGQAMVDRQPASSAGRGGDDRWRRAGLPAGSDPRRRALLASGR
jgi:hypothetical protein